MKTLPRRIPKEKLALITDSALDVIYENADGKYDEETAQSAGDIQDARQKASENV